MHQLGWTRTRAIRLRIASATLLGFVALGGCPADVPGGNPAVSDVPTPPLNTQDHTLGDAAAPLIVIEYGDFQCPACGSFFANTFPTVKANYIDTGRVLWVFRHFPLTQIHANALQAAKASECAADSGLFWEYHDLLFPNQANLDDSDLSDYAELLALGNGPFEACFQTDDKLARVQSDIDSGTQLGVDSTPTFFFGGKKVEGALSADEFTALLDAALEELP